MLRSLFTGISGLKQHQTMMDVTGNNIANVNTTGFKSSNTVFEDTMSQMVRAAGAPQDAETAGGVNPAQVGLGVRLGGINTNFGQGSAQSTGRAEDIMIQGDGFFAVQQGGETLFTRAGSFNFDQKGNLVTNSGARVQGWNATDAGVVDPTAPLTDVTMKKVLPGPPPATLQSFSISTDGTLIGVYSNGTKQPMAQLASTNFVNPAGLEKVGGSMFRSSVNSGEPEVGTAGAAGRGTMVSNALEMSNVDLAAEFTNLIISQRGFQANSKVISTSDDILQELVNLKR